MEIFGDKTIVVTGSCGTVGAELISQLLSNKTHSPKEVIGLDNNENAIFFQEQLYLAFPTAKFFVADIRDENVLQNHFSNADIVFHTAALKHVILNERSPDQAISTNILGVQNVISAAQATNVSTIIFASSDKAVNPTNVMGTSKLMGERLMTAANSTSSVNAPSFSSVRFGNLLGSNGSVIPIFHNQIAHGGPITLTDENMTRFVMTIKEGAQLLLDAATIAKGGEVFVTKMPVVKILDLAQAMIEELSSRYGYQPEEIQIKKIGCKPGEKLYEELMNSEETRRTIELENFFSVLPAFRGIYQKKYEYPDTVDKNIDLPYTSATQKCLSVKQIKELLSENELLASPINTITQRYWPGDKESQ